MNASRVLVCVLGCNRVMQGFTGGLAEVDAALDVVHCNAMSLGG